MIRPIANYLGMTGRTAYNVSQETGLPRQRIEHWVKMKKSTVYVEFDSNDENTILRIHSEFEHYRKAK